MTANSSTYPLKSFAVSPSRQPPYLNWGRAPNTSDLEFPGTRVQDNSVTPPQLYETTGAGAWFDITPGTGLLSTLQGNSGGQISPVGGLINIVGASGVTVVGSTIPTVSSTLTITANPSTFSWNVPATSTPLVNGEGYVVTAGAQSFSLPATAAVGDEYAITLAGGTSWAITQGAGQSIIVEANTTSVGAGGSVTTTGPGQTITLVCIVADLTFQAYHFLGALSVV